MTMVKLFKFIAILEGISLLLLFFVAMPLKYIWDMPQYIYATGMTHGILFIAYVFVAFLIKETVAWNTKTFILVLAASLVPFGTFYVERKFLPNKLA